jgi:hypothetical protein
MTIFMKLKGTILAVIAAFAIIFGSCKKGINDPSVPFSTRDARITNDWVLNSSNASSVTVNVVGGTQYTSSTTHVFDGTTMKETSNNGFGTQEQSYPYSYELNIKNDGTYDAIETNDGVKNENTNYWFWADSDKNKIAVTFSDEGTFMIDRLAKDELILTHSETTSNTQENGDVSTTEINTTMTFAKK